MSTDETPKFAVRAIRPMFVHGKPVAVDDVVHVAWADALVIVGTGRGRLEKPADQAELKKLNDGNNQAIFNEARRYGGVAARLDALFRG